MCILLSKNFFKNLQFMQLHKGTSSILWLSFDCSPRLGDQLNQ